MLADDSQCYFYGHQQAVSNSFVIDLNCQCWLWNRGITLYYAETLVTEIAMNGLFSIDTAHCSQQLVHSAITEPVKNLPW